MVKQRDFDVEVLRVMSAGKPQLAETVYRRGQYQGHGTRWTYAAVHEALERLAVAGVIARCAGAGWYEKSIVQEKLDMDAQKLKTFLSHGAPKVVVVGGGYVGLPLAAEIAKSGCWAVVLDTDEVKVASIKAGRSYVGDVSSETLAGLVKHEKLSATPSAAEAYCGADVVLICVPTPLALSREPDTSFVCHAVGTLRENLWRTAPQLLVVLESTVYPGFTREELADRLRSSLLGQKLEGAHTVHVAFSPERVDPASKTHGVSNTPKVVGGVDAASTELACALYGRIVPKTIPVDSADAAELTKLLENTFRAVNIALINEFAVAAEKLGVDIWEVVDAASTKPFGFMKFTPGPGCGGECLPCDPPYLSWRMKGLGHEMRLLDTAMLINRERPKHVVQRLADALNDMGRPVMHQHVLVVGVAYKPDVPDTREAPALDVIRELAKRGALVAYVDSHVPNLRHEGFELEDQTLICNGPVQYKDFDAAIIVTHHAGFDYQRLIDECPLVLDTRGITRGMTGRNVVLL